MLQVISVDRPAVHDEGDSEKKKARSRRRQAGLGIVGLLSGVVVAMSKTLVAIIDQHPAFAGVCLGLVAVIAITGVTLLLWSHWKSSPAEEEAGGSRDPDKRPGARRLVIPFPQDRRSPRSVRERMRGPFRRAA